MLSWVEHEKSFIFCQAHAAAKSSGSARRLSDNPVREYNDYSALCKAPGK